jgi:hypothetical protein
VPAGEEGAAAVPSAPDGGAFGAGVADVAAALFDVDGDVSEPSGGLLAAARDRL